LLRIRRFELRQRLAYAHGEDCRDGFFAGMGEAEIGTAHGLTERTVRRDWERARLLLSAVLRP